MFVNTHTEQSVHKKKNLCSLLQLFIQPFLSDYKLFNMGRVLSTKELQPNRLRESVWA